MTITQPTPFLIDDADELPDPTKLPEIPQLGEVSEAASSRIEIQVAGNDDLELASGSFDGDQVWIGRSPSNDLVVEDPAFSRYHAVIERRGPGQYVIRDLQSLNGLYQTGRRVASWNLNSGDSLTIGEFHLRFQIEEVVVEVEAPSPEDLARALGLFGRTISVSPREQEKKLREASSTLHAWLRPDDGTGAHPVDRDVVTVGGIGDADVQLHGRRVPPWCAVIVRGPGGFSVHNVSPKRGMVRLDGEPLPDSGWLSNSSVLEVLGRRFVFYVGAVPESLTASSDEHVPTPAHTVARRPRRPRPASVRDTLRVPVWLRVLGLGLWVCALIAFLVYILVNALDMF